MAQPPESPRRRPLPRKAARPAARPALDWRAPANRPAVAGATGSGPASAAWSDAGARLEAGGRFGWRIVAAKEFADHLLSVRFLVLLLILGLATVAAVYAAASGIRSVASDATGTPALFLKLFTVAPEERLPPFFVFVGFLGPLLGIAFGFDAVNGERSEGTLPRLLSQPIHRDDVVNGKFVAGLAAIALILVCLTLLVAGVGIVQLGIVPTLEEVLRMCAWLVVAVLYIGFWLAFATLCSVVLRRAATSALVAIGVWLVLSLFATLLVDLAAGFLAPFTGSPGEDPTVSTARLQVELSRLSPGTLYEEATTVLLDPNVRWVGIILPIQIDRAVQGALRFDQSLLLIWPQLVGLVAVTVVCFAAAYISFMRQEVRA
ncbi:MAG TPA: ABC transporter permease [Candidatus Limnocylindrales bacterium]|nr:ABC transporter permease [Candidatus Limnocylindrales bacterium]